MSWDEYKPSDFVTRSEFGRLHADLQENTKQTQLLAKNTNGVVEAFQAASGAFRTLEVIGRLAKPFFWIGSVSGGIVAAYVNFRHGK
jgi:hypothetical protein